jgi:hypothetical protein
MAMYGYFDVFPEKWATEVRTATLVGDGTDDPLCTGTFLFSEYFCTDLTCDCRRVLIKVFHAISHDVPPVEVASISYCWDPSALETLTLLAPGKSNPFLDPFHRQAPYASALLEFWSEMVKDDRAYAARLQRHYDEIRAQIGRAGDEGDGNRKQRKAARKMPTCTLTKQERIARKRLLARVRKRK